MKILLKTYQNRRTFSSNGGRICYNKSHFVTHLIYFTTANNNAPSYLVKMLNSSLSNKSSHFLR